MALTESLAVKNSILRKRPSVLRKFCFWRQDCKSERRIHCGSLLQVRFAIEADLDSDVGSSENVPQFLAGREPGPSLLMNV